ncbi:MAG: indolepyruvate oxidoreductase subunit beta [Candidatus Aminicenantaceae bacterium]
MKQDIILAGVGGQGILSIAFVLDQAALLRNLHIKQAEVHGMAQRGGAVQSHLRLSDEKIYSDLIPKGKADLLLSVELLESLRYLDFLKPEGCLISSRVPYKNIPDYPDEEMLTARLHNTGKAFIIDSDKLSREAGHPKSQNMVMLGAASHNLVLDEEALLESIRLLFQDKGEKTVEINQKAFRLGRDEAAGWK